MYSHHQIFQLSDTRQQQAAPAAATATAALCSSVFDLYRECCELRHAGASSSFSSSSSPDAVGVVAMRRVATALTVLLEARAALRQLVVVKRGVQFCVNATKEAFRTIRMDGGFSGNAKHPREDVWLALCERIATHFTVLAALVGGEPDAQAIALVRACV